MFPAICVAVTTREVGSSERRNCGAPRIFGATGRLFVQARRRSWHFRTSDRVTRVFTDAGSTSVTRRRKTWKLISPLSVSTLILPLIDVINSVKVTYMENIYSKNESIYRQRVHIVIFPWRFTFWKIHLAQKTWCGINPWSKIKFSLNSNNSFAIISCTRFLLAS